ncbi:translation initiation factor eIF-6 [Ferroglobus placidus DSM 10642]|uniref:Translation initiation factor 6 n=1 Tax=Ferroglobus placidus (strain DSM 10642 / AEDII12DO) TaxID=589924 RepID=D3S0Y5_FERPA|nr:translation initiation factor IF-6 [Ferroglobus placidus]ADC64221.1 translation initiation factor eIF-6 [Ferroglobus placidus DSM 10642]
MPKLLAIHGSPLIGMYVRANEDYAIIGVRDHKAEEAIKEELEVKVIRSTILGSELVGAMLAMNSSGAIVSDLILEKELKKIEKYVDVYKVSSKMTCMGNVILMNDRGAIVHPEVEESIINVLKDELKLKVAKGTVGGIKTVGMAAVVTNSGGLLNPNASEWEVKRVEETLEIETATGTVNFGSDMVGTGVVANSKGYVAGKDTTGFELGLIEEALGFV